jgi:hypothetical protein
VSVLAGDISGYLQWPADYYVGAYPYAVAAGDLNGDLKDDLVTANIGDRTASVLLNNGSGGFGSATNYEVGDSPASVVLADFTHDGKLDLATANAGSDDVTVLRGNGSGAFAFVSNSAANDNPWAITAADFNGDTWQDVAVANPGINKASVLMNTTDWRSFQVAGHPSPSIIGETHEITVSALDNDGNPLTSYTGTIHFDSSDLIADLPPDYTFLPTDGGTKTFFVTLNTVGSQSITVNDMATTAIMGRQSAIVVNPPPPATFSIDNVSVLEGDGAAVAAEFTITRGGNMATTVTVNYSTANGGALAGSDYVAGGALLTFGPNETTKKVIIQVNGDLMDEFDQSFYVNLWGAGVGGSIIDSQGVGTIMDNDPPPVINITPLVSKSEGKKNGLTTFDFLVTLSSPSEKTITVNFATATGTASSDDYIANSNSLTFWPGDTSKTITVMVRGDQRKEPTETFFVNLSNANNATLGTLQGIGEILDDDPTPRGPKNR